jgi:predicted TIM-barrel fold metal-dependent hydrolase
MMDDRIIFGSDSAVIDSRYRTREEASLKLQTS